MIFFSFKKGSTSNQVDSFKHLAQRIKSDPNRYKNDVIYEDEQEEFEERRKEQEEKTKKVKRKQQQEQRN